MQPSPYKDIPDPVPLPSADERLSALTSQVRRAMQYLDSSPANWVAPHPGMQHDVAIIGGGQTGLALAFALRRAGIPNFTVIDQAPPGREGVWLTCARMQTLRSPKTLPGLELGFEGLTLRAWYEARYGEDAYREIARCGRTVWADYIAWYRQTTGIEVRNHTRLESIEPARGDFVLKLRTNGKPSEETARKVVLATGMTGSGAPHIPAPISALPKEKWIHTDDVHDFSLFKGRSVGILGAASSAFDAAASAIEHGARDAHLFVRHGDLARITRIKGMSFPGVLSHFHELPDRDRWSLMRYFLARSSGPIADTVRRATRFPNFFLHFSAPWDSARMEGDQVVVAAAGKEFRFDSVIAGTGYRVDMAARPELRQLAADIALWRDRYRPPEGDEDESLGLYPYLGAGFEFLEKHPGTAPQLRDIHCINNAALLSFGRAVGEITSIGFCVPKLVSRIGADFLTADREAHIARMRAFNEPDLTGDEYRLGDCGRPASDR